MHTVDSLSKTPEVETNGFLNLNQGRSDTLEKNMLKETDLNKIQLEKDADLTNKKLND